MFESIIFVLICDISSLVRQQSIKYIYIMRESLFNYTSLPFLKHRIKALQAKKKHNTSILSLLIYILLTQDNNVIK